MTSRCFIVIILFLSACACSDTSGNNADGGCELGKTMCFPEDNNYTSLDPVNDSSVFECSSQASYIDAGTSPGNRTTCIGWCRCWGHGRGRMANQVGYISGLSIYRKAPVILRMF